MLPNGDCNRYDSSLPASVYQRERAYRCGGENSLRMHDEDAAKGYYEWIESCARWEEHCRYVRANTRRWRVYRAVGRFFGLSDVWFT